MHQPNTSANGNNHRTSIDVLDDTPQSRDTFYDSSNPLLASARPIDKTKQSRRKRKLIILCFIFVLLAIGVFALNRLLTVNRVKVSVQSSTDQEANRAKTKEEPRRSDNNSSAEAIKLARQALGSDTAPNATSFAPTTTQPLHENSVEPTPADLPSLTGTVLQPDTTDKAPTHASTESASRRKQTSSETETPTQEVSPSRANATPTIYVDDSPTKSSQLPINQLPSPTIAKVTTKAIESPAVFPPFGTMLPVRTQGVIFTLRNNSYARLELVRDMKGTGWSLPRGTVLIGRANGSEYDRTFITVIGYIDSRDNRLVKLSGEVLGGDGGSGIQGKRVVVDTGGLKRTLSKIASSGMQAAGLLASGIGGQRTVILDGAGNRIIAPVTDEASRMFGAPSGDKRAFVKVEAGSTAYVMVSDLPNERPAIDAQGEAGLQHGSLTDHELMELLLLGTREEITAAIPLMSAEQKSLALRTLTTRNEKK